MKSSRKQTTTASRAAGRFAGKRVLVTGAARGIGHEIASRFSAEGALVAYVDVDGKTLAEHAKALPADSRTQLFLEGDATRHESADLFVATTVKEFGGLDVLVNNVGVSSRGTIETTPESDWDRMNLNPKSIYLVSRAALPHLRKAGGGAIVNIGSSAGMRGIRNTAAYGTSKAAVVALTKLMALDHAAEGIRVNCVCPGLIQTDNSRRYTEIYANKHGITVEETMQRVLRHYPLGRVGRPRDVADAVLFLASDEAAWITGENLNVDGGRGAGTDEEDL